MRTLARYSLCTGAATALLAGCGGSQPPIGAPGAMPQSPAIATHADHNNSRMPPEAQGSDLIYVAAAPDTIILSYPRGKLLAKIKNVFGSMCSDSNGDVFVAGGDLGNQIFEYAHGGTTLIATLTVPSQYEMLGCAIDPTTGNLAASGFHLGSTGGVVAVFQNAQGNSQIYINQNALDFFYCGYDSKGNLFVNGITASKPFIFSELPKASSSFVDIQLPPSILQPLGIIQWDGSYITDENPVPTVIYRISVSGSVGRIVGTTQINDHSRSKDGSLGTWIQGNRVIAPQGGRNVNMAYWDYPGGGNPRRIIKGLLSHRARHSFSYVTISVPPSQRRVAKNQRNKE